MRLCDLLGFLFGVFVRVLAGLAWSHMQYVQVAFADAEFKKEVDELILSVTVLKPNFDLSEATTEQQQAGQKITTDKSGSFYKAMALLPCGIGVMAAVGKKIQSIEQDKSSKSELNLLLQKVAAFKTFAPRDFKHGDLFFFVKRFLYLVVKYN